MKYLIIPFLFLISSTCMSQAYMKAFGLRTGNNSGFTYKNMINPEEAYEGILSLKDGIKATILRETYDLAFIDFSDRLYYFYGFGGHFGFSDNTSNSWSFLSTDSNIRQNLANPVLGVDLIIGLEYRFINVPFIAGLEIKPYFDILGENYFDMYSGDLSLSIKYIID